MLAAGLIGLLFATGLTWWAIAEEIRSVDRQLDLGGQTLVEGVGAELNDAERDLTRLARILVVNPVGLPAQFDGLASQQVPAADSVAIIEPTPDGLTTRFTTDPDWLPLGTDPSLLPDWGHLGPAVAAYDRSRYLSPIGGDSRVVVWESLGSLGTGTSSGLVLMAVDLNHLVDLTGFASSGDAPVVTIKELSPTDAIAPSDALLQREYLFVGDRRWEFDLAPRPGTIYSVDWTVPVVAGGLAVLVAAAGMLVTHTVTRRRRTQRELVISGALSEDKDRFLLALSHQIRTPLTAVVGFLDVLRTHDDLEESEKVEFLNRAADQAEEMSAIVHDILVVTRDDLDMLVITTQPTNPVREALAVAAAVPLGEAVIEIHPSVAESPLALADPVRVRQILRNLVANAIRYGGRSVHITAHLLADEVVITVADDGPGLPDDVLGMWTSDDPRPNPVSHRSDSLGLGLRVARLLAVRMQGRIEYRRSGSLTIFELILRAAESDQPAPALIPRAAEPAPN